MPRKVLAPKVGVKGAERRAKRRAGRGGAPRPPAARAARCLQQRVERGPPRVRAVALAVLPVVGLDDDDLRAIAARPARDLVAEAAALRPAHRRAHVVLVNEDDAERGGRPRHRRPICRYNFMLRFIMRI